MKNIVEYVLDYVEMKNIVDWTWLCWNEEEHRPYTYVMASRRPIYAFQLTGVLKSYWVKWKNVFAALCQRLTAYAIKNIYKLKVFWINIFNSQNGAKAKRQIDSSNNPEHSPHSIAAILFYVSNVCPRHWRCVDDHIGADSLFVSLMANIRSPVYRVMFDVRRPSASIFPASTAATTIDDRSWPHRGRWQETFSSESPEVHHNVEDTDNAR